MDAEQIARKARKSISLFCLEECKAYCCRKGYLIMTKEETEAATGKRLKYFQDKGILKLLNNGKFSFDLRNNELSSCPSLKDLRCEIYRKKKRPAACRKFPLFLENGLIKLAPSCLAVQQGVLYPYIYRLEKLGYKLAEINPFYYLDLNRLNFDPPQKTS